MTSVPRPTIAPDDPGGSAPAPADDSGWAVWMAPAAVALGLGLGLISTIIIEIIGHAGGSSLTHPSPAVSLVADLFFDLSFVVAALYFARMRGPLRPSDFGFRRTPLGLGAGVMIAGGLGYYVVTYVYAALFSLHGSDKLPSELGVHKSTAALIGAALFVCVLAPIAEEFFFRGCFFGVLRRMRIEFGRTDLGPWLAAVVTGLLFGLAHLGSAPVQYLLPLGFLGFVLCLIRWRTGSLYPCMALHAINNSLALGVNTLDWNAAEILGLAVASLAVITVMTGPLALRAPQRA
jgi:uncharacterized protein